MIDALELGRRIVEIAESFVGACACKPFRDRIVSACGMPFDFRKFDKVKREGVSTCYIFALNVLRLAGVEVHNWHVGEAIGTLKEHARVGGYWQPAEDDLVPSPGDILYIGRDGGTHVCVVVGCDGTTVVTVDGGQECWSDTDGHEGIGRQMIARVVRQWAGKWVKRGNRIEPVVGWVDIARANLT